MRADLSCGNELTASGQSAESTEGAQPAPRRPPQPWLSNLRGGLRVVLVSLRVANVSRTPVYAYGHSEPRLTSKTALVANLTNRATAGVPGKTQYRKGPYPPPRADGSRCRGVGGFLLFVKKSVMERCCDICVMLSQARFSKGAVYSQLRCATSNR